MEVELKFCVYVSTFIAISVNILWKVSMLLQLAILAVLQIALIGVDSSYVKLSIIYLLYVHYILTQKQVNVNNEFVVPKI